MLTEHTVEVLTVLGKCAFDVCVSVACKSRPCIKLPAGWKKELCGSSSVCRREIDLLPPLPYESWLPYELTPPYSHALMSDKLTSVGRAQPQLAKAGMHGKSSSFQAGVMHALHKNHT